MRKKMILLALTLFIGLSACGNDDKELPDEPEKNKVEMEGMNRKILITLPAMNR